MEFQEKSNTKKAAMNRKQEEEEEAKARADIWKYAFGFAEMAVIRCAIELGIADVLEDHRPMPISELSSALGCSETALFRIMRFLTHRGIFKEEFALTGQGSKSASRGYVQTSLSRLLLRRQAHNSIAPLVLLESSPVMLAPWLYLSGRVSVNDNNNKASPFEASHGEDVWQYAASNPSHSKLINDAMACDARVVVPSIIDGCSEIFEGLNSLVDVGGGDGTSIGLLVQAFPWIRGINFDLPYVVSVAPPRNGVDHVAGDMFESVPKADAAFFLWVLHDWADDECIRILRKCREASIPEDKGKVIIVDAVVEEGEEERVDKLKDARLMLDMVMMAHTNKGKERTEKEWASVLNEAGFSRFSVKHIQAVQSVIVAYP